MSYAGSKFQTLSLNFISLSPCQTSELIPDTSNLLGNSVLYAQKIDDPLDGIISNQK